MIHIINFAPKTNISKEHHLSSLAPIKFFPRSSPSMISDDIQLTTSTIHPMYVCWTINYQIAEIAQVSINDFYVISFSQWPYYISFYFFYYLLYDNNYGLTECSMYTWKKSIFCWCGVVQLVSSVIKVFYPYWFCLHLFYELLREECCGYQL